MSSRPPLFSSELRRFQLRWRAGLFFAGILSGIWWTGLALLLLGVLDFYAGFSDPARKIVGIFLVIVAAAGFMRALWNAITFMQRDAATAADRGMASGRREALSALELHAPAARASSPLGGWLRERAVGNAAAQMRALRFNCTIPGARIKSAAKLCAILTVVIGICALLLPGASWIIARRLLQPDADIPPYSPLTFSLGPRPAQVLYGGEILVTADIAGGKIDAPVRCLTRDPVTSRIEDAPAFQEKSTRFSGKLEKVAGPVDVAFAVGRARSAWMPVTVRMQPKIEQAILTVDPPAYSRLPRREFAAGAQDLAVLPGSRITARVSSNRPLSGGILRIGADAGAQQVAAETEDAHRVRFSWIASNATRLALDVRDALGSVSEPLQLDQKLIPDERPDAVLRQPAGDVLATPDSDLPLEASASDDLGLSRVTLVRQLHGYRERSVAEPIQTGARNYELNGRLNLAPFGLSPGQVIELTLEAADTNPNLLGISVSEPARVHIIAREQYAAMLRSQTTLEEFSERYIALNDAMNEARKAIEALEKAAQSGNAAQAEEARKKALEAHKDAAQIFGKIAKDFPIFSLDETLSKTSLDAMKRLFDNAQELESLEGKSPADLGAAIPSLRNRLGEVEKQMAEPMKNGERAAAVGKIFEQAAIFQEVLESQRALVKDLNRIVEQIRRGEMQAGNALRDLGNRQAENAERLRKMDHDLDEAITQLPPEFSAMGGEEQKLLEALRDYKRRSKSSTELWAEGRKFLEALREFQIPPVMDEGAQAAAKADGKTADDRAGEALAKLEALLRKKNGFCAMCRHEGEMPFPWPEDLAKTLQQLLQALIPKPAGAGSGEQPDSGTSGGGMGGLSENGYWMRGKMPQMPIYGPARQRFMRNGGPQIGSGKQGAGAGSGKEGGEGHVDSNALTEKPEHNPSTDAMAIDAVPEAYREAVKRYFSSEETRAVKPSSAPPAPKP